MKKKKRSQFKGISLEQKWKCRNEPESYVGSKSGGKFMQTIINENGNNRNR